MTPLETGQTYETPPMEEALTESSTASAEEPASGPLQESSPASSEEPAAKPQSESTTSSTEEPIFGIPKEYSTHLVRSHCDDLAAQTATDALQ
ncbi:hypothetical protein CYMTET_42859 [Cymbomonas tetramitiformis]|uniref:Uncharacterized protein n=1 Tax=Cymbomonas tetramitiformis TaxID=36881 RepID=A0AAE0C599_9CHLO|nr:hypothetical protein CYMTET_42859 [Cymbomonas tetramitiformis]